ncbi:Stp1/IreP family PP2C-type Ser/Thr phosphatase [soil metagenome]
MKLDYSAISDLGRYRKDNQDSAYAGPWLLTVCDGVGGAARGDLASSTAVNALRRLDRQPPSSESQALITAVAAALRDAHEKIATLVAYDPDITGTSTTATVALFDGNRVAMGHVGDSRAYLLRDGELSQLTHDHTFVQTLVDEGRITEEEARTHPHRNLILNAIDGSRDAEPDLFLVELVEGDRLLLCSDGVSGALSDARLADVLSTASVDFAAVELIRASLEAGATDNVTCVVADVVSQERPGAATEPMLVGAAGELSRRRPASRTGLFRGHRSGDTGELPPIPDEIPDELRPGVIPNDPLDPENLRYAPQPPRRFVLMRRLLVVAMLAGIIWVAAAAGVTWTRSQYFVGEQDGHVTIFRGINTTVVGVSLATAFETSDVQVDDLSGYDQSRVTEGIAASSLEAAEEQIRTLAQQTENTTDDGTGNNPGGDTP